MRVNIGNIPNWIGPYQIADWFQKVGLSDKKCQQFGTWLDTKTPVGNISSWFHKRAKRKVEVKLDTWDIQSADRTLAIVILPVLQKLRAEHVGYCNVDCFDTQLELDDTMYNNWLWILDEMIWTFEQWQPTSNWESQYYGGAPEWTFEESDKQTVNPATGSLEHELKMIQNNGVATFDKQGYDKHLARINNGFRLFGKYFTRILSDRDITPLEGNK